MFYNEFYTKPEFGDKNRLITLTGVSGVGKDYLLRKVAEIDPRIGTSVTIYNFGELLFEQISLSNNCLDSQLTTRDDLHQHLTQMEIKQLVEIVVEKIIKHEPALLNTHVVYKQRGSLQINPDINKKLNACWYIYVWSDPEAILLRRQETSRKREQESIVDVTLHQQIAFEATRIMAYVLGAGFKSLNNKIDNVTENVSIIQEIIDKV